MNQTEKTNQIEKVNQTNQTEKTNQIEKVNQTNQTDKTSNHVGSPTQPGLSYTTTQRTLSKPPSFSSEDQATAWNNSYISRGRGSALFRIGDRSAVELQRRPVSVSNPKYEGTTGSFIVNPQDDGAPVLKI